MYTVKVYGLLHLWLELKFLRIYLETSSKFEKVVNLRDLNSPTVIMVFNQRQNYPFFVSFLCGFLSILYHFFHCFNCKNEIS